MDECIKPFESEIKTLDAEELSIKNGTTGIPSNATRFNAKAWLDIQFTDNYLAKIKLETKIENACGEKPSGRIFKY